MNLRNYTDYLKRMHAFGHVDMYLRCLGKAYLICGVIQNLIRLDKKPNWNSS